MAAVYFDLDGTLLRFAEPYDRLLDGTFEAAVGRTGPDLRETYTERFFEHFAAFEPDPYRAAMADVCAGAGLDADPAGLAGDLLDREVAATAVPDGTRALLRRLGERHRLGVLTNGVGRVQRRKLDHHGLASEFDAVVTSYDVGAHKPDRGVFAAAREALDAEAYAMVGDDFEADVEPAREAGFRAIHLDDGLGAAARVPGLDALADLGDLFG